MRILPVRFGAALLGAAALATGPLATPAHAANVEVQILSFNDFHGRLEAGGEVAGAAVLAGAIDQLRSENSNTVVAAAGDSIGASTFVSFIQDDNPTVDALNEAGLNVSSVGNHEFDQGWPDLRDDVIGGSDGHPVDFPYLGANVYLKSTGEPALPEYKIIKTGGVSIGFVGAVTDQTGSLVNPEGVKDLTFGRPVEAANRVADQLSDGDPTNGEADIVILLVHEGAPDSSKESAVGDNPFGDIVNNADANIDAIVSGHTHQLYNHMINGRPVISSGSYGMNLGQMKISVDASNRSKLTSITATNLDLVTCDPASGVCTPNYPADPKVQKIVDDAVAKAQELGDRPLGKITQNITRAFDIVDGALTEDRGEESTLGNLVADVQLAAAAGPAGGAQIAFMNPGGLRADLCYAEAEYEQGVPVCVGVPDDGGVITYRDAANVQPFANTLVTMKLTGEQIRAVLQQQSQPAGATRPFLALGVSRGFTYTYTTGPVDPGTGQVPLEIKDMWLNGTPIDPGASYSIVVNSFLAAGGDNFTTFADGADRADSGKIDLQSFVDYMGAQSPVSPDLSERAIDLATQGDAQIKWPEAIGDPPAMRAGTERTFSLATTLPVALPEQFSFTAEAPAGISIDFGGSADTAFETLINGLPAGDGSVPFTVSVDESVAKGDYNLVFTLDRTGDPSIFDGNPLATPQTFTVALTVSAANQNPGGGIGTGLTGGGDERGGWMTVAAAAVGVLALVLVGGGLRRRRDGSVV